MSASLVALAGLVMLAFLVETAAGFGSAVVALTLGGLFLPLPWLMAVLVPVNMLVSAVVLARDRSALDSRLLTRRVLPAMLAGLAVGLWAFGALPSSQLSRAYALFVVALAGIELWRSQARPAPLSRGWTWAWLFAGGLIHGLFTASGPLVVFVMSRSTPDKRSFRANLAAIWLVLNGVWLASYAARGLLTAKLGLAALCLLPPMALGMVLGELLHRRLAPARFRTAVYSLVLAGGLSLLVTG